MSKELKIVFTSDVHGYFFDTDYKSKDKKPMGLVGQIQQCKKDGNTLFLDGGDMLQGSPLAYYLSKKKDNHIISDLINELNYDVVTVGNHDFNYGQDYQNQYLHALHADVVCQNILNDDGSVRYPYVIKTLENGLKVGIVGIVTDWINIWEKKENLVGVKVVHPFDCVKQALNEIKDKVDITVCLYHGGFENDLQSDKVLETTGENIGCKIARELDFDILLTGHQHMPYPGGWYHGTYVVQSGCNATKIIHLKATLDNNKLDIKSGLYEVDPNFKPTYNKEILQLQETVNTWLDEPVATLSEPLLPNDHLYCALHGSCIADFINEFQLQWSKADISVTSLANEVRGFYENVTIRDILTTYPFPNNLVTLQIDGKTLKELIEQDSTYLCVVDGKAAIANRFLSPKITHYNYDYYKGITYNMHIDKPKGSRITDLCFNNKPVKEDDTFKICLNNYRASGAGNFEMILKGKVIEVSSVEISEQLVDYFSANKHFDIKPLVNNYHVYINNKEIA